MMDMASHEAGDGGVNLGWDSWVKGGQQDPQGDDCLRLEVE